MINLLLYFPVAFAIIFTIVSLKEDDTKAMLKKALKNFFLLTGIVIAGCIIMFIAGDYL